MPRSGLNGSLISKLFHPVTSQNNCDHDKGRSGRGAGRNERTQRKKKNHPLSFFGWNHRKMDRAPLSTCKPHAQILTGSKKYSGRMPERDGKEFDSFYFTKWLYRSLISGKAGKQKNHHIQAWYKNKICITLKSDCKWSALWVSITLKTAPICHALLCQNCWFLEQYFLSVLRCIQKFQSKAEFIFSSEFSRLN